MRAVLCLRPASAPLSCGSPAPPPARPPAALTAEGVLYHVLADAAPWSAQVQGARVELARLPAGLRVQTAAGLATTRFAARCAATLAHPGTLHLIPPGQEAATLAPLPLTLLPGLPAPLRRDLYALRVLTLGDLAALPPALLSGVFGPAAQHWPRLARGEDPGGPGSPGCWAAVPLQVELALSARPRLVGRADLAPLAGELAGLLARAGRAAATVAVTVCFAGGAPVTRTTRLAAPATAADDLLRAAWPLVEAGLRVQRRRPLALTLAVPQTTVAAVQAPLPLPLPATTRRTTLDATVAALQARFGPHVISYGLPHGEGGRRKAESTSLPSALRVPRSAFV